MHQVKRGDRAKVPYTEKLEDVTVLETSKDSQPLEIEVGCNIVPVIEKSVIALLPT